MKLVTLNWDCRNNYLELLFYYTETKRRPQKPNRVNKRPQQLPKKDVSTLPDYDENSEGVPEYKTTKGIGSSSGVIFIRV
jgi:hypothetical protein